MNDGISFADESRYVRVLKNVDMHSKNFKPGLRYDTKYWQTVEIIQTVGNTRSYTGTGTVDPPSVYLVDFYAPVDEKQPFEEINYNHHQYKNDYELLMDGQEDDYV